MGWTSYGARARGTSWDVLWREGARDVLVCPIGLFSEWREGARDVLVCPIGLFSGARDVLVARGREGARDVLARGTSWCVPSAFSVRNIRHLGY